MLPDFNRLKVFYHVHRLLSISAAADVLHLSQSAVSQHIRKLEDELRTPLFTRLPRRLVATQAGERLFYTVQSFVHELEQGLLAIQSSCSEPRGLLRLGAPVAFGESVLPKLMAEFRERYPDVRFHMQLGHPDLLLPLVCEGELDLAFADMFFSDEAGMLDRAGLNFVPFVEETLMLVCSKEYFDKKVRTEDIRSMLETLSFVAYSPFAPAVNSWLKHHCNLTHIKPEIVLSVESVRSVITAVEHHAGMGVVPAHLVSEALDSGRLIAIHSTAAEMVNRIAVVQLSNKIPTLTEKTFVRYVEQSWRQYL